MNRNQRNRKKRAPVFNRLREALEEASGFVEGNLTLRTFEVPAEPPRFDADRIASLRNSLRMSQGVFARVLNVSPKTVQAWERGTRRPAQCALRLLQIIQCEPEIVARM